MPLNPNTERVRQAIAPTAKAGELLGKILRARTTAARGPRYAQTADGLKRLILDQPDWETYRLPGGEGEEGLTAFTAPIPVYLGHTTVASIKRQAPTDAVFWLEPGRNPNDWLLFAQGVPSDEDDRSIVLLCKPSNRAEIVYDLQPASLPAYAPIGAEDLPDAVRSRLPTEPNEQTKEPVSLEELRQMDGNLRVLVEWPNPALGLRRFPSTKERTAPKGGPGEKASRKNRRTKKPSTRK